MIGAQTHFVARGPAEEELDVVTSWKKDWHPLLECHQILPPLNFYLFEQYWFFCATFLQLSKSIVFVLFFQSIFTKLTTHLYGSSWL